MKKLPVRDGIDSAKYPGEIEYTSKQKSLKDGIILPETLVLQLEEIAKNMGLAESDIEFLRGKEA